jgi:hypothetical protein
LRTLIINHQWRFSRQRTIPRSYDNLTINTGDNESSALLEKQVAELAEKNEEHNFLIKGRLVEKEKEAEETKKTVDKVLARQEMLEHNSESLAKWAVQLISRLEGLVNGT